MQVFDYALFPFPEALLIIVPVNLAFESKNGLEQQMVRATLEASLRDQGLMGVIIPAWRGCSGRFKYLAPPSLLPLLGQIGWSQVTKNISGKVTCSL